jgi:ATP phosphoribosyltransferase
MIKIALAKGRLGEKGAEFLSKCGVDTDILKEDTRKLVLENKDNIFQFFMVKPTDVPTYVEYGVADIGIVGKDTLIEEDKDIYEMLDLKYGKCKLCIAGFKDRQKQFTSSHLRVATKYENTAKKLYMSRGEDIEIIPLNGSIELAPIIGLSDVILDIVESGNTLRANGLEVLEEIYDISARLVVNKVSLKTKAEEILPLIEKLKEII